MGGLASSPRSTFWVPHSPPLPIGATIAIATGDVVVTFDRQLKARAGAKANWHPRANLGPGNFTHTPQAPVVIAARTVTFATVPGGMTFPPLGINYLATPPNVESLHGVVAAPFDDLPLAPI